VVLRWGAGRGLEDSGTVCMEGTSHAERVVEEAGDGETEVESRELPHSAAPAAREQTRGAKRLI